MDGRARPRPGSPGRHVCRPILAENRLPKARQAPAPCGEQEVPANLSLIRLILDSGLGGIAQRQHARSIWTAMSHV